METISVGKRKIGKGEQTYVIAEIGINHNGRLNIAKELIKQSTEAGADAVKFQKRDAASIMIASRINKNPVGRLSKNARDIAPDAPEFGNWSYPDLRLELSDEDYVELKKLADKLKIDFSASPWDEKSTDFLVNLDIPFLKIPSVEIKNPSYLEYVAKTKLPLIMSTGTADIHEIDCAVALIKKYNKNLCLLQCTSSYPSRCDQIDLRVIETLRERYRLPVGYSGHEAGLHVSIAAVALGACVIERHVTLSRKMSGPDQSASIEMHELKEMVRQIRETELALGTPHKKHYQSEDALVSAIGRSVAAAVRIPANTKITKDMLTTKGPSTGIPPEKLSKLIGQKSVVDIPADTLIMPKQVR
jgi:sialic acid synthase SpsE